MRLSGQSQAELIKAALVVATAGVIVYYGKKFVDSFTAKIPDIASIPEKIVTAAGDALGSASAAVVDTAKSGIEKASESANVKVTQAGNPVTTSAKIGIMYAQNATDNLLQYFGLKSEPVSGLDLGGRGSSPANF
jgi:hypothetical protein